MLDGSRAGGSWDSADQSSSRAIRHREHGDDAQRDEHPTGEAPLPVATELCEHDDHEQNAHRPCSDVLSEGAEEVEVELVEEVGLERPESGNVHAGVQVTAGQLHIAAGEQQIGDARHSSPDDERPPRMDTSPTEIDREEWEHDEHRQHRDNGVDRNENGCSHGHGVPSASSHEREDETNHRVRKPVVPAPQEPPVREVVAGEYVSDARHKSRQARRHCATQSAAQFGPPTRPPRTSRPSRRPPSNVSHRAHRTLRRRTGGSLAAEG